MESGGLLSFLPSAPPPALPEFPLADTLDDTDGMMLMSEPRRLESVDSTDYTDDDVVTIHYILHYNSINTF